MIMIIFKNYNNILSIEVFLDKMVNYKSRIFKIIYSHMKIFNNKEITKLLVNINL